MDSFVARLLVVGNKRLVAAIKTAAVLLYSTVESHVCFEVCSLRELLATPLNTANKRFDSIVS